MKSLRTDSRVESSPSQERLYISYNFQMKELTNNGVEQERVPNQLVDETVDLSETDRGISGNSSRATLSIL